MGCRYHRNARHKREARDQAFAAWEGASCARMTTEADRLSTPIALARPPTEQLDNTGLGARTDSAIHARQIGPGRWRWRDTTPPAQPTIAALDGMVLSGRAEANSSVTVYDTDGRTVIGTTQARERHMERDATG
jgi:hypothetical protein